MKLNFLFLAVVAVALLPAHAESTPDAPHDKNVMLEMKPYSGTFTYQSSEN